jgi:hypothetical protein
MRALAVVLAGSVLATGCPSSSYKIPGKELQRLSVVQPELRGQTVRVQQELGEADVGPPQPVTAETQIVFFPHIHIRGPERRRHYQSGSTWGTGSGPAPSGKSGIKTGGGGISGGGSAGDGKGAAIAILVVAAMALVIVAAVEGSRFDGFAQLHPMHPVYLEGRDGERAVMPLAWIDPETAAWAKHGYIRRNEGPFLELHRAPLDREGWNYSVFGGIGTFESADGSKARGTATTIQLGYFPRHEIGILGSVFFGWRQNRVDETLFETRYTLELQGFPIAAGPVQAGGFVGIGGASRFEDGIPGGDASSSALTGGAMLQLDINTRIALTARFGLARAHGERMSDAMLGLSVY